eukprot:403345120
MKLLLIQKLFELLIKYLNEKEIYFFKCLCKKTKLFINTQLSHFILSNLAKDKKTQFFTVNEETKTMAIISAKQKAVDMMIEILKLRPDIKCIETHQNLDVDAIQKLFVDANLCGNIKEIIFKKFMWYEERAEIISQFFMKNKTIKKLQILTVNDCNRGLSPLLGALQHNRSITHYKIAINTLGQESIVFLTKLIQDNRVIESLDLTFESQHQTHPLVKGKNMNRKNENFAVRCLESIYKVGRHSNIKEIFLKGCLIAKQGCKYLGLLLESNFKLEVLDLSLNKLQTDSIIEISKGLKENQTLRVLDLSDNLIEEKAMKILAEALKTNETLTTLNLNNNTIHQGGCKQLAECLIQNRSIKYLSISNNFIKDEGCEAICHYLAMKSCILQRLDLSDNFIREKGSVNLLAILDYKESDNPEEDKYNDELYGIIGKNDSLKYLDMSKNDIKSLAKDFGYIAIHRRYKIKVVLNGLR